MDINISVCFAQHIKTISLMNEMLDMEKALNEQATHKERYVLRDYFDHVSDLEQAFRQGDCDYSVFFTLNPDIVSFIESWPYTSHIIILDDLSICPSLFSGWEQFPSTDGSQEWRPTDWQRTETTVLVTTRERLVENVIAFLKREGLSFKEGQ